MEDNQPEQNNEWKNNARCAIYAMAGLYLLTLAYNMFKAISSTSDVEQAVMIIFTILFTIVGLCLIVFGLTGNRRRAKHQENADASETPEDNDVES